MEEKNCFVYRCLLSSLFKQTEHQTQKYLHKPQCNLSIGYSNGWSSDDTELQQLPLMARGKLNISPVYSLTLLMFVCLCEWALVCYSILLSELFLSGAAVDSKTIGNAGVCIQYFKYLYYALLFIFNTLVKKNNYRENTVLTFNYYYNFIFAIVLPK